MDRVRSPLPPGGGGTGGYVPPPEAATRLPLEGVVGTRLRPGAGTHHRRRHPVGVMANTSNPRTRG